MEVLLSLLFELLGPIFAIIGEFLLYLLFDLIGHALQALFSGVVFDGSRRAKIEGWPGDRPSEPASPAGLGSPPVVERSGGLGAAVVSWLLHLAFGALAGWLTLLVAPDLLIRDPWLAIANIAAMAVGSGLVMTWLGARRRRRDRAELPIDRFGNAFLFALALGLVRFLGGH